MNTTPMLPSLSLFFEIVQLILSGATFFAIWIAYKTYKANLRKQEEDRTRDADKELTTQALASLGWAYDALTSEGSQIPPKADRLNWLTSARHLLRYSKIVERIKSETYRTIHAEREEFWRHRFYLALNHGELRATQYWSARDAHAWPENIELSSALVVVRFSNWPKHMQDPTDEVDRDLILNDEDALLGHAGRGLRAYAIQLAEAKKQRSSGVAEPFH